MYSVGEVVRVTRACYDTSDRKLWVEEGELVTVLQPPQRNYIYCQDRGNQEGYVSLQQVEQVDPLPPPPSLTPPPLPSRLPAAAAAAVNTQQAPTPTAAGVNFGGSRGSSFSGRSFTAGEDDYGGDYEQDVLHYEVCTDYRSSTAGSLTVTAGEVVMRVAESSDQEYEDPLERVLVKSLHTGHSGRVARSCLTMVGPLYAESWFVGRLSRGRAEQLLLAAAGDTFLIRQSESTDEYVISMTHSSGSGGKQVRHRKIIEDDGHFLAWAPQRFSSLQKLVAAHMSREGGYQLSTPYDKFTVGRVQRAAASFE